MTASLTRSMDARKPALRFGASQLITALGRNMGLFLLLSGFTRWAQAQEPFLVIDGNSLEHLRIVESVGDLDNDGAPDFAVGVPIVDEVRVYSGRSGDQVMRISGVHGSAFGNSVAGAGDFDGDGVPDLVVGASSDDTTGHLQGAAHIISGATGIVIATMYGQFFEEAFGFHVAGLGDLDQDGRDDVAVAGAFHRLVRIHGGPDGHLIRTHWRGYAGNGWRRPAIASTGDTDADGVPDYVIGWGLDNAAGTLSGTVVLFSGRGGTAIHEVHGPTASGGGLVGSCLGISVGGIGDLNGDGVPDFVAGAPGIYTVTSGPPPTQASVRVYSGKNAELLGVWDGAEQTGSSSGSSFGFHVAGGGDLNGDNIPDILVGAPHDAAVHGTVSVYSGRTGERVWRLEGIGYRVHYCTVLGPMNSDALPEFAIGDEDDNSGGTGAGRITVYLGAPGDLERHCSSDTLSARRPIRLEMSGALGIGNNYLTLYADGAPPGGTALFVYGPPGPPVPFEGGWLCTGPPSHGLAPPLQIDSAGHVEHQLDFTQPPLSQGPGQILPGSTWSFQLYCRDPAPSASGPRISDGLLIQFPP